MVEVSTQNSLEEAINKLSNDEVRDALYEICLIVSRSANDKIDTMEDDIIDLINQRIYHRL